MPESTTSISLSLTHSLKTHTNTHTTILTCSPFIDCIHFITLKFDYLILNMIHIILSFTSNHLNLLIWSFKELKHAPASFLVTLQCCAIQCDSSSMKSSSIRLTHCHFLLTLSTLSSLLRSQCRGVTSFHFRPISQFKDQ